MTTPTPTGSADRSRVEARLLDYVAIDSVNPGFRTGVGEADLAAALADDLMRLGLDPVREPVHPGGRDNVLARLEGRAGAPVLMLQAHMDTVGTSGQATTDPSSVDGWIHGRGACDTKGSLVAIVEALHLLREIPADRRATVVAVGGVDEEFGATGAPALVAARDDIDLAIVGEPTSLRIARAHKGVLRFDLSTTGRAAHASKAHLGENAIHAMAHVLERLERHAIPALEARPHPLLGPPTLVVAMISGGRGLNIVPDRCTITLDRRAIPGETPATILGEMEALVTDLVAAGVAVQSPSMRSWMPPLETHEDHPLVAALQRARASVLGDDKPPIGVTYGSDAAVFAQSGIPSVVFGPGSIDHAHGDFERVSIEETARAAEILAATALELA